MSPLKPGQGFARRVTLETLEKFAPFLLTADQADRGDSSAAGRGETQPKDPTLEAAERLFEGQSIKLPHRFKSSRKRKPAKKPVLGRLVAEPAVLRAYARGEVLLAEIPRASNRWGQANFNKEDFTGFFGANSRRRLMLWNVHEDRSIAAQPEVRPGVSVKSRNFRIELGAAAGRAYPTNGRPIGVFVRTAAMEFRYMLLMPGTRHHQRAAEILAQYSTSPRSRARRLRMRLEDVRNVWPDLPLWPASRRP